MTTESRPAAQRAGPSIQTYARIGGVLFLISLVAGGVGEFYIPSVIIVSSDAAATAKNIIGSNLLFRMGFAAYLVEALCDVALSLFFYVLLSPVRKDLALLATFFRLLNTAVYGVAEFFYIAPLLVLGGAGYLEAFSPDQLNTLALLSLNLYRFWGGIFTVFSGVANILLGYLIFRSGYLPRVLGVLISLSGVGFGLSNFALVLAPAYALSGLMWPAIIAAASLTVWLLVGGVDVRKWEERKQAFE